MLDEKGRLFGKINIVDLLVIILVLGVAILVGVKLLGKGGVLPGAEGGKAKITFTVQVNNVYPEVYDSLLPYVQQEGGDQLMASGNLLSGYVVDVKAVPHDASTVSINSSLGALVLPMDDNLLDLTFTVEATVPNADTNELGTQEIRIGKSHTLKTTHFEFAGGLITDCQWNGAA
ncbi:MAG TPA: DUF4330 domain-containing protein [Candidatus Flavonifractor merdigallinarum]|uniref:DUF4330 domain-containing protein n=1 Tax=Candidatus Flavonifractor merdigallinarum TaxID=2838589 RepID=A0A9D2BYU7_9FIRM|nr:DUF4330 domain-containing protein [Candidatus Flavonifractor merdigallinarum]